MKIENMVAIEDRVSVRKQNERLLRESIELEKRREEETARRRAAWTATPDAEKLCTQCGLKLDAITIAKVFESPITHRAEHPFCNSIEIEAGVVRFLVGLLRETYEGEDIPLESLRKVVEVYQRQRGRCAISQIKLAFPVEGIRETPAYDGGLLTPMDRFALQRQFEKEQAELKRAGDLHSSVLDYDEENNLRLVSKTVAKMMEGLTPEEFREIIRTLHAEINPAFPESRSFNSSAAGRLSINRHLIR